MPRQKPVRDAADDVGNAANWASVVGKQVSTTLARLAEQGEVVVSVDVGPFEKLLKFRIELPK